MDTSRTRSTAVAVAVSAAVAAAAGAAGALAVRAHGARGAGPPPAAARAPRTPAPRASPAPATPPASAAAGALHPPPPGQPLIWFSLASDAAQDRTRLHAAGWDGVERGAVELPVSPAAGIVLQSPDGSRLLAGSEVFDLTGAPLGAAGPGAGSPAGAVTAGTVAWGDDDRSICVLTSSAAAVQLHLVSPGSEDHLVGTVGQALTDAQGLPSLRVAACSPTTDRAEIETLDGGRPSAVELLRLSDGAIVARRPLADAGAAVADRTGATFYVSSARTRRLERLDVVAGRQLILPGLTGVDPVAVSWDGSRVAVGTGVVDPRGRHVWDAPAGARVTGPVLALPGGGDLTVVLAGTTPSAGSVVVVHADGSTAPLAAGARLVAG